MEGSDFSSNRHLLYFLSFFRSTSMKMNTSQNQPSLYPASLLCHKVLSVTSKQASHNPWLHDRHDQQWQLHNCHQHNPLSCNNKISPDREREIGYNALLNRQYLLSLYTLHTCLLNMFQKKRRALGRVGDSNSSMSLTLFVLVRILFYLFGDIVTYSLTHQMKDNERQ